MFLFAFFMQWFSKYICPLSGEYWCYILQTWFIWRRNNWMQRKPCVSPTDSSYRSLGTTLGTLESGCIFRSAKSI